MPISNKTVSTIVNCLDAKNLYLPILSPIPSYGTTIFALFILPIIVIFGIIGNGISLVILRRAAKKNSSHFYLWCMALFDIISLISYIPTFWAVIIMRPYYSYTYGSQYSATWVEYGLLGKYVCQLRLFFTFTARTCSVYSIVLVTVERFIMVVFPLKRDRLCNIFVAKVSVIVLTIASVLINLPWFFAFEIVPKPCFPLGICVGNIILTINKMIEFIFLCFVPSLIIIVSNGVIVYILRSRLKLNLLVDIAGARKQERDITIRLLAISFAFFFLTIPSVVIVCIHSVQELNHSKRYTRGIEADVFVISIILFAVNLAVNFIIYCLTGKNFRTAALSLVKCDLKKMRKYRSYLIGDSTSVTNGDIMETNPTSSSQAMKLPKFNSVFNRDSFQQKQSLIRTAL